MSEEALRIAEKRRDGKDKREKERYIHLNVELQIIARRDKKAFLSDQCKEAEENNSMGKTRDLCKKIRDTKGTFHEKMDTVKDRNGIANRSKKILRRGGKNTQKNYTKKDLHDPDSHDGVIIHLESDILECEGKWALGSITTTKVVEVMEFQLSYFKS